MQVKARLFYAPEEKCDLVLQTNRGDKKERMRTKKADNKLNLQRRGSEEAREVM